MKYNPSVPSIKDMAEQARKRIPRFALDYLEGGIGEELGLQRNREDLDDIILCPRYLRDVTSVDTSCELFGRKFDLGVGISPVGLGNMMWPRAEQILSTTAQRMNIPYVLSTMSTTPLEDIRRMAPDVSWFQLYVPKDVAIMQDLLQRVNRAGFKVLVVTVDIPVGAKRDRELKNGLILPFRLTPALLFQAAVRPRWAIETLRHGTPRFVNIDSYIDSGDINHLSEFLTSFFMCGITLERIKMIRSLWQGPLVIKGLLHAEDIEAVVKLGVDGVIVSNHAGRQLDAAPSSTRAIQAVPDHLKRQTTILMDSGIRTGLDIVRARALGAKACFSGRSFMYSVAGVGDDGVRQAIEIFRDEITRTLQQLGCVQYSAMDHTWIADA